MPHQQRNILFSKRRILGVLASTPLMNLASAPGHAASCIGAPQDLKRGPRFVEKLDFSQASWTRNEYGVEQLTLSQDPVSGAITFALRTPKNMQYPERAHFYDCDEDLFQMEGEFHHQEELRYTQGDYIYRPPGSVYGNSPGSDGGIIIASLNRKPVRYHFSETPEPWAGEYLVDRRWNPRQVTMMHVQSTLTPWTPSALDDAIQLKLLRGDPGKCHRDYGARSHSPWGSDSAFMMRVKAGFKGALPLWRNTQFELLVTQGKATREGASWHRGCYHFGYFSGKCVIEDDLIMYVRAFRDI